MNNGASKSDRPINAFSSGGGGEIFETNVITCYLVKMLCRDYIREINNATIEEVRFQQSAIGFLIDDLVIILNGKNPPKIAIQIKHNLTFVDSDREFKETIEKAWKTYSNKEIFTKEYDKIVIVVGTYNKKIPFFEQINMYANTRLSGSEFVSSICQSSKAKKKLFDTIYKIIANLNAVSDDGMWEFMKCLTVKHYDIDNQGRDFVDALARLNQLKSFGNKQYSISLYNTIKSIAEEYKKTGGSINRIVLQSRLSQMTSTSEHTTTYHTIQRIDDIAPHNNFAVTNNNDDMQSEGLKVNSTMSAVGQIGVDMDPPLLELDNAQTTVLEEIIREYPYLNDSLKYTYQIYFEEKSIRSNLYSNEKFIRFLKKEIKTTTDKFILYKCFSTLYILLINSKKHNDNFLKYVVKTYYPILVKYILQTDALHSYSYFKIENILNELDLLVDKDHLCKIYWQRFQILLTKYLQGERNNLLDNCSKHLHGCKNIGKMRKLLIKRKDIPTENLDEILRLVLKD